MPLEYSDRAIISYAEFYSSINEKKIFIEDASGRLIHERVISNIIGPGRIKRIFPLGGRLKVIEEWERNREKDDQIYIIDGDLDTILGIDRTDRNLYQIKKYCIENMILTRDAIREVMSDYTKSDLELEDISETAMRIIEHASRELIGLYVLYAIAYSLGGGISTTSESIFRYFKNGHVCKRELFKKKKALISHIIKKLGGRRKYIDAKNYIIEEISGVKNLNVYISGKGALIPLIHGEAKAKIKYPSKCDVLVKQLSRYYDPDSEPEYRDFLERHFPSKDS